MSQPVITVENLSKEYAIGNRENAGETFREMLISAATAPFRRLRRLSGQLSSEERIWALKDVSFEVKEGEVVGIIGRNGAGKSTLLKILSRITEPTKGCVELRGRVASLLEVGTGFHQELTGRENIYLSGAILGMTRQEIDRKFDQIVEFSDVERFLDTPVKRYSSGMYVRLAFAVAAHLEPEILIVDEILAVGDLEFQRKCLGKMSEAASGGRTVLFVSHNLAAVESLCQRCLYLAAGVVVADGSSDAVIDEYVANRDQETKPLTAWPRTVNAGLVINRIDVSANVIRSGEPLDIYVEFCANDVGHLRECALLLYSLRGIRLAIIDVRESGIVPLRINRGSFAIKISIASIPLVEGTVSLGLYLNTDHFVGNMLDLVELSIVSPTSPSGFTPYSPEHRGILILNTKVSADTDLKVIKAQVGRGGGFAN